jgi:CubicO group peptidase (beta-lactamase class C family)
MEPDRGDCIMTFNRRHLLTAAAGMPTAMLAPGFARAAPPGDAGSSMTLAAPILQESGAPALAGVVADKDRILGRVAVGLRHLGAPDPVSLNDLWHIGSNTKAMTSALYGRLVDQKKAAWSATVASLFPDVKLDPAWAATTIENLMSHRAGISDGPLMAAGWLMAAHADTRPLPVQRTDLAARVFGAPPAGKPGQFEYSNIGFVLAGAAIERITRTSWEDAITQRLFRPLGMASAGFGAPTGDQPWGHQGGPGALTPVDPKGLSDNPPALGPAGRVRLSLADYGRFARIFLNEGGGYLSRATFAHLTTPAPGEGRAYALGWAVVPAGWGRGPILAHEGSNTLWHAVALIAPARGVAILTACNAGPEGSRRAAFTLAVKLQQAYAPA